MSKKRLRVVAAGTFDGLHDGHRYYLRTARQLGDTLTVIVARDATVALVKQKSTRRSERQRLAAVAALPEVDHALLGQSVRSADGEARFQILLDLRPDVIGLGYDQPVRVQQLRRFLRSRGLGSTRIVRIGEAP